MRMPLAALLALLMLAAAPVRAKGERAGDFDYFVLSLSWSPNWCRIEGDARKSPQCKGGSGHGWIMHGLWPQFHRGYPSYCQSGKRPPNRSMTAAMADIMGTPGLAWHQWKKHGSCTNLSAEQYYSLSRKAYEQITRPAIFRKLRKTVKLPASVVEEAFVQANPGLFSDAITITCRDGAIQEARICLTKTLDFTPCGRDVIRDCQLGNALFTPLR